MIRATDLNDAPVISYVLPCLNESSHLEATLSSLRAQAGVEGAVEVIVVDGGSSDGSPEVAAAFVSDATFRVRVVANPRRFAGAGFNIGIAAATAPAIVLGGARTVFPKDHASSALDTLRRSKADVVGGGVRAFLPAGPSPLELAIASLYASPVGAGAAAYHRRRTAGAVDTVYCGCYRREVLERVGGVDERFVRGQDGELNSRIRASGHVVWFDPRLSSDYQFRGGLRDALNRASRTGRYAAMGWKLQPHTVRPRHLAPLLWTAFVLSSPVIGWNRVVAGLFAIYFAALAVSGIRLAPRIGITAAALTVPVFACFHLSYGLGQFRGLLERVKPAARIGARIGALPE